MYVRVNGVDEEGRLSLAYAAREKDRPKPPNRRQRRRAERGEGEAGPAGNGECFTGCCAPGVCVCVFVFVCVAEFRAIFCEVFQVLRQEQRCGQGLSGARVFGTVGRGLSHLEPPPKRWTQAAPMAE